MTTYNSIETAQRNSTSAAGTPLAPTSLAGKVRVLKFSWTAISSASADLVFIGTLPKGAAVIDGWIDWAAMGTSVTFSLGTLSGSTFTPVWSISEAAVSAGSKAIANTAALAGVLSAGPLAADTDVYFRYEHDAIATTPDVYGFLRYVVD